VVTRDDARCHFTCVALCAFLSLVCGRLDQPLAHEIRDLGGKPRSHAQRHGVRDAELGNIALPQWVEVDLPKPRRSGYAPPTPFTREETQGFLVNTRFDGSWQYGRGREPSGRSCHRGTSWRFSHPALEARALRTWKKRELTGGGRNRGTE